MTWKRILTQKQWKQARRNACLCFLILCSLLLIKLAPNSPVSGLNWCIVLAPVWVPILALLIYIFGVLLLYVISAIGSMITNSKSHESKRH